MKEKQNGRKFMLKNAVKSMITLELTEWPPNCVGFAYQPMRPEHKPVEPNGKQTPPRI